MKIFVTRNLPGRALSRLSEAHEVDVWEYETPPTKDQIIERAKECAGIITLLSDDISRNLIAALPELKVISQYAVGYNNIDITEATRRGIIVTNTPGVLTEATADLTWALILSVARRIAEADRYVREGAWRVAWGPELLLGMDIFGATLGIIGMGRIGYAVARRTTGFDMQVLYYSRSDTYLTRAAEKNLGAIKMSLEQLLAEADIVSIHVPLTDQTRNMIAGKELSLMKQTAILINTSRGAVVNENDLYEFLRERRIYGAGLDVFQQEPTPLDNHLLELDNVVATPHIGSATVSTRNRMAQIVVDNILQALDNKKPKHLVNHEVYHQS